MLPISHPPMYPPPLQSGLAASLIERWGPHLLNLGQPGRLWPTEWGRGDTVPVFQASPSRGLCVSLLLLWLLHLCHESMPRLAYWMESHEQSCVNPAVAGDISHIREQKQDQQTLLVNQLLTSPDHQNCPEGRVNKNTSYCTSLRCCVCLLPSIFVVIHNWYIPFLLPALTNHPTACHLPLLGPRDTEIN